MKRLGWIFVCLLVAASCGDEKGNRTPRNPTAPTPSGEPRATAQLLIYMIGPCGNTLPIRDHNNVPSCVPNLPQDNYAVVITSSDLASAIQIRGGLGANESWSGALLHLQEYTLPTKITNNVRFVVSQTDRFTYAGVPSNGRVDFSLKLEPGAPPNTNPPREVDVVLSSEMTQIVTISRATYRIQQIGQAFHVIGDLP